MGGHKPKLSTFFKKNMPLALLNPILEKISLIFTLSRIILTATIPGSMIHRPNSPTT